ncbi:MAG TPA: pyruvate flavodoxin oxidoreductase subunit gamma [Nitratifractor sp.]|nr:pyruvate flavodoxin oxidoreductase subunit gamma [Nitratifractor sp.]HHD74965.1 pyruvate flavodoxin oxidoreductase subunit gamma [Nitratifractor sp.]HHH20553.1 pyruvate flavodoxin oxidoreductase subunit gamma [Nitratifractor sp.]
MVEIRWHSRAGQGAVTGAKGLGSVVATTGKEVQAYALYGSAKRGAAMNAYNRIDDKPITNHETKMYPDFVFVIDPALAFSDDITKNDKPTTKYIITTHLSKEDLVAEIPALQDKSDRVFVVDCMKISLETIGRAIPNTPILGAFMKVSGLYELDFFLDNMKKVLSKFPQKIIDANMAAISRAYDEVK